MNFYLKLVFQPPSARVYVNLPHGLVAKNPWPIVVQVIHWISRTELLHSIALLVVQLTDLGHCLRADGKRRGELQQQLVISCINRVECIMSNIYTIWL